jgi:hypothetical protein
VLAFTTSSFRPSGLRGSLRISCVSISRLPNPSRRSVPDKDYHLKLSIMLGTQRKPQPRGVRLS